MKLMEKISTEFAKTFPSTGQAHLDEALAEIRIWAFENGLIKGLSIAGSRLPTELIDPRFDSMTFQQAAQAIAQDIQNIPYEDVPE